MTKHALSLAIVMILAGASGSAASAAARTQQQAKPPKVTDVVPVYPEVARRNQIEGLVMVQITVGVDGRVSHAQVVRSVAMLDDAALTAVRQWVYDPVGLSAPVRMMVTVPFSLKSASQPVGPGPARRIAAYPPAAVSSRPVAYVDGEVTRRLQALAQGTARRQWGISHERLLIDSDRTRLVSSIQRNDPNQKNVVSDTVTIICGDYTRDLECRGVRVLVSGMDVAPVSVSPFPYTSTSGIRDRSRVSANFHASDLRNGFVVKFLSPDGTESTYEVSRAVAENDLLLGR